MKQMTGTFRDWDQIHITGLQAYGYHGVEEEERRLGQRFEVNLTLYLPLRKAGCSDRLEDTVNYAEVCQVAQEVLQGPPFQLIERVAEVIAEQLLSRYSIPAVRVQVVKPHPPIPGSLRQVSVEIYRESGR